MANRNLTINVTVSGTEDIEKLTKEFEKLKALVGEGNVTVESQEYSLVTDRKPKAGDFVKFTDDDELPSYLTVGKYYEITEIDFADDPQILDDDGDDHDTGGYTYEVYEKVGAEQVEQVASELKVGDYAKVVGDNYYSSRIPSHGLSEGTVVKINVVDESGHEQKYEGKPLDNTKIHYFVESDLVEATDEEVAEAKAEARWAKIGRKPNEFKKGDIVRLNQDSGANYKGEIVEIAQDGADSYFDENGDRYAGALHWFELITPVEQRFDKTEATA